jgi:hypothetical protein
MLTESNTFLLSVTKFSNKVTNKYSSHFISNTNNINISLYNILNFESNHKLL